jgi:HK97 family phage major capsid protein
MEVNKISMNSRILHAGTELTALDAAKRTVPGTGKVTLNAKLAKAEVRLSYEVLEDNIEQGSLMDTLITMIGQAVARDLEELMILADTASGDADLAITDGIIKRATAHTVDASGARISPSLLSLAKKAMPAKYKRDLTSLRYYTSVDVEEDYRLALASRGTALGDDSLIAAGSRSYGGIPVRPAVFMPDAKAILANPKNFVMGVHRDIRIESQKFIQEGMWVIVVSLRVDFQVEETDSIVKLINIATD